MEFELSVKQETRSCENRHLFMLLSYCDETKGVDRPENVTSMSGVTGTNQMIQEKNYKWKLKAFIKERVQLLSSDADGEHFTICGSKRVKNLWVYFWFSFQISA